MKLISEFKENEAFEMSLRSNYSNEICNIVIEWTEEALAYVFKETLDKEIFKLGRINRDDKTIKYTDEEFTLDGIIRCIMNEMEIALDGTENPDIIKEELRMLSEIL